MAAFEDAAYDVDVGAVRFRFIRRFLRSRTRANYRCHGDGV